MQEAEVQAVLRERGMAYRPGATICGTVKSSVAAYENGLGPVMSVMKDHVLNLRADGVAVVPRDDSTGRLVAERAVDLGPDAVRTLRIVPKLLHLELVVETAAGNIEYRVPRSVIGCPWHRQNLSRLLVGALDASAGNEGKAQG